MINALWVTSDVIVNPDWLYPDPDPQNLMHTDPDPNPGQWIHSIDFNTSFKSKKKPFFSKFVPKTKRLSSFLGSDLKIILSYEKTPKKCVG